MGAESIMGVRERRGEWSKGVKGVMGRTRKTGCVSDLTPLLPLLQLLPLLPLLLYSITPAPESFEHRDRHPCSALPGLAVPKRADALVAAEKVVGHFSEDSLAFAVDDPHVGESSEQGIVEKPG